MPAELHGVMCRTSSTCQATKAAESHAKAPAATVQACGSGGTTAGLALGNHLGKFGWNIWAYGVCDDPPYFYDYIQGLLDGMGATAEAVGTALAIPARCWASCKHAHHAAACQPHGFQGAVMLPAAESVSQLWSVNTGEAQVPRQKTWSPCIRLRGLAMP